ncbi:hypothetical protein SKAU_G00210820 [Synaphobranchus kaupii]|uniref:Uncharacterized protein n=1 Tax=Synaphobranchus kaupii TaxID=118154 RepID=A0A9Q1F8Z2_SYNKA|nr:hypothetical protein SKAU_G00210820 [Synaphobranchus kaupii]
MWLLDKLLKAKHTLFHNVPARREDYSAVTKSTVFPLSFCGHRWIENLPVVERALAVWPSLLQYMDTVRTKKLPNPGTASFDTIAAALKDPLILAKLQFYMALARTFNPFLKKYQTDEPVMLFLCKDLAEFIMSTKGVERMALDFRSDCMQGLSNIVRKVQEKSPLKYPMFEAFLSLESRSEEFLSFPPMQKMLDIFLCDFLSKPYPELWAFCQKLLILSHGQAFVERGFSVNKQELLNSVASARSRYRVHLDQERRKKKSEARGQKRKAAEDYLEELKKRKKTILVSEGLARDADRFAEEAVGKAGSKMAELTSKSNILRRGCKEKLAVLEIIEKEIVAKGAELRR